MPYTTSIHIGSLVNHNEELNEEYRMSRANIDPDRVGDNIVVYNRWDLTKTERNNMLNILSNTTRDGLSLEQVLEAYNASKTKSRDKKSVEDLLDLKVNKRNKDGSRENILQVHQQEIILQVGNEKNSPDPETSAKILKAFVDQFMEKTKDYFILCSAVIHMDEATPHLHLSYIPLAYDPNKKRGLPLEFSHNKVIEKLLDKEMEPTNYKSKRSELFSEFRNGFCEKMLDNICREYGIETEHERQPKREHQDQNLHRLAEQERAKLDRRAEIIEHEKEELITATRTAAGKLKEKKSELDRREDKLNDRERDFRYEWEIQQAQLQEGSERLRKERESLEKEKKELDRQRLDLQSAYAFHKLFFEKYDGDPLICPDSALTIQDVLNTIQDTKDSLEGLLTIQPDLLEQLPEHLQAHCEPIIEQQEREEQQPELEHSLQGGLFG